MYNRTMQKAQIPEHCSFTLSLELSSEIEIFLLDIKYMPKEQTNLS